jgi:hypothetical protein
MKTPYLALHFACFVCALAPATPVSSAPGASASVAQGAAQDAPADKRPEIAAKIEKAKGMWGDKKGGKDAEIIATIDELLVEYPKSGPKDKASIVAFLGKSIEQKRDEVSEGVPNNKLAMAAAVALGAMGPESTKTLEGWIDDKRLKKDVALVGRLVLSLGKTKDPAATRKLIKLLEHPEPPLVSAAAQALGEFKEADLKVRKEAFESMLKVLMSSFNNKEGNPNDLVAKERYDIIGSPIITSLRALSGHDEREPAAWQAWWNNNKNKDWNKKD